MLSTFHIHKEEKYGYVDKKLCENETVDIVLQPIVLNSLTRTQKNHKAMPCLS